MDNNIIELESLLELNNRPDMDLQIRLNGSSVNKRELLKAILRERAIYKTEKSDMLGSRN